MIKKLSGHKGAVAVFLVIVLVPMITCASMFVEVARVKLAQSVVSSAGDVALNTVLTRYDYNLNDFYGMLASAQNMSDVLSSVQDYFVATLKSQNVDTTYLQKYINSIKGMFVESDDITDLLKISIDDNTFKCEPTKNGALNNAALIKTQIVDFMKYRSPANAAAALLSSLMDLGDQVKSIPAQTECADKQQEFYDTEEDLLKKAKEAYDKLKEYEDIGFTRQYVEGFSQSIQLYENEYKCVHIKLVFDLAGTENLKEFTKQEINYSVANSTYSDTNASSWGTTKGLLDSVAAAMKEYLTARANLVSVDTGNQYTDDTYKTRYYVNVVKELNTNNQYSKYVSKANDLAKKIAQLKNAYAYLPDGAEGSSRDIELAYREGVNACGKASIDDHYDTLIAQFNSIVQNDFKNNSSTYNVLSNRLTGIYEDISKKGAVPNDSSDTPDGGILREAANNMIIGIYNEINEYYTKIKNGMQKITDSVEILNKIKGMIDEYKTDFSEFKTAAFQSELSGDYAKYCQDDIKEREADPDIMENLTEENVQALIDRLNNIKSALGEMKSALEGFKYNGKQIIEIKNLSDFEKASGVELPKIGKYKTEIRNYAESTFSFEKVDFTLNITDNNNPSLQVEKPVVYKWMENKFKNSQSDGTMTEDQAKDAYESYKNDQDTNLGDENEKGTSGGKKPDISTQAELPSNNKAENGMKTDKTKDLTSLSSFITDLFGDLSGTLARAGTTIRDDLYTVDYIMSMFSYDTYESEGMLDLWRKEHKDDKITLVTDFKTDYKDKWASEDKTDTYNKSLTNHLINDNTCFSFCNEVEYILYGNTNALNKAASYGTIYMIRLALNIGPVFGKWFNSPLVSTTAASISACSLGVIPEVLIRFAITLGLLLAEAAVDLSYIKKGIGIKLLKDESDLFISFPNDNIGEASDGATGAELPYLQYSDYLKILLFMSLLNSKKADGIYLRTADVIQVNMDTMEKDTIFRMANAQVYFTLTTKIKVTPLILGIPLIDNSIQNIKQTEEYKAFDTSNWNTFNYTVTRGY